MVTQTFKMNGQQQEAMVIAGVNNARVEQCVTVLKQMLVHYVKNIFFKHATFPLLDNILECIVKKEVFLFLGGWAPVTENLVVSAT